MTCLDIFCSGAAWEVLTEVGVPYIVNVYM